MASGRCRIVGICDVDRRALDPSADRVVNLTDYQPGCYRDYREMLEKERPEIVIVTTCTSILPTASSVTSASTGWTRRFGSPGKPRRHRDLGQAGLRHRRRATRHHVRVAGHGEPEGRPQYRLGRHPRDHLRRRRGCEASAPGIPEGMGVPRLSVATASVIKPPGP